MAGGWAERVGSVELRIDSQEAGTTYVSNAGVMLDTSEPWAARRAALIAIALLLLLS